MSPLCSNAGQRCYPVILLPFYLCIGEHGDMCSGHVRASRFSLQCMFSFEEVEYCKNDMREYTCNVIRSSRCNTFCARRGHMPASCHREQEADCVVECGATIGGIVERTTDSMIVGDVNSGYGPLRGYSRPSKTIPSFGKISLDLSINSPQMTTCHLTHLCTAPTATFRTRSSHIPHRPHCGK